MQLRDDEVLVVARVAEVGGADAVAGQVEQLVVRVDQQVAGLGRVVELGAARGALAVDAAEVELRGVVVDHPPDVLLLLRERRLVQRHVVVDELAEVDVPGRHGLVVEGDVAVLDVVQRRLAVVHLQGQRGEQGVRRVERLQPLEHRPEAGLAVAARPAGRCPSRAGRRRRAHPWSPGPSAAWRARPPHRGWAWGRAGERAPGTTGWAAAGAIPASTGTAARPAAPSSTLRRDTDVSATVSAAPLNGHPPMPPPPRRPGRSDPGTWEKLGITTSNGAAASEGGRTPRIWGTVHSATQDRRDVRCRYRSRPAAPPPPRG